MNATVKDLQQILGNLIERGLGDYEVQLTVHDYYSSSANCATATLRVPEEGSTLANNYHINTDTKTAWFVSDLQKDYAGGVPKVIYRTTK